MKNALCLAMLLFTQILLAATPEQKMETIIPLLESDDFDVREKATRELVDLGEQAVPSLTKRYKAEAQPETKWRLMAAIKGIFIEKTLPKDPRYRKLYAEAGFEVYAEYDYDQQGQGPIETDDQGHQYMVRRQPTLLGLKVNADGFEGAADLKGDDLITEIDGNSIEENFEPMAGQEYEMTVRRFKAENPDYRHGEYETKKIKVRVGWKEDRFLSDHAKSQIIKLEDEAWREYSQKLEADTSSK
jgi:hypothetical protein